MRKPFRLLLLLNVGHHKPLRYICFSTGHYRLEIYLHLQCTCLLPIILLPSTLSLLDTSRFILCMGMLKFFRAKSKDRDRGIPYNHVRVGVFQLPNQLLNQGN